MSGRLFAIVVLAAAMGCAGTCGRRHEPARIDVVAAAPGLSADQVDRSVTIPLTHAFADLPGVEAVDGMSMAGMARVTVTAQGSELEARQAILERLATARSRLPAAIAPTLGPVVDGDPVVARYVLDSDRLALADLRALEDRVLRPQLLAVPGVTGVSTCGGHTREIQVDLDPAHMQAHDVTLANVRDALSASTSHPAYRDRRGTPVDELGAVAILVRRDGTSVSVRDVARVQEGGGEPTCTVVRDGREVIAGAVLRLAGADARSLADDVQRRFADIGTTLPSGVRVTLESMESIDLRVGLTPGTSLQDGHRVAYAVARELLAKLPDVAHVTTALGVGDGDLFDRYPDELALRIELRSEARSADVAGVLATIPGIAIGPTTREALRVRVFGDDHAELVRLAARIRELAAVTPAVAGILARGAGAGPTIVVEPDPAAMARHGVSASSLQEHLEAARTGLRVAERIDGTRRVEVRLRLPRLDGHQSPAWSMPGAGGTAIPLHQLASLRATVVPTVLLTRNGRRYVEVLVGTTARGELHERLSALALPPGYVLSIDEIDMP